MGAEFSRELGPTINRLALFFGLTWKYLPEK
jgi:hypothetical protein